MEIPSEIIEPHALKFMMNQLESLFTGFTTPEQVRCDLKAVDNFISISSSIHARYATSNEYYKITSLSDIEMRDLAKRIFI